MNVLFLAYRDWAINVFPSVLNHPNVKYAKLITSLEQLASEDLTAYKLVISCGWSEKISNEILDKIETIGVHCAELDRYSYGSPIQLQIIDGIKLSKHRIFPLKSSENSSRSHAHSREFSHEVDLSLNGGIDDIFLQLSVTSIALFNMFLNDYPNITWTQWPAEDVVREKRTPLDSRLTKVDLQKLNTEELYNLIRSLEDPYPNVYLEDEAGFLYFQKVQFKAKKS